MELVVLPLHAHPEYIMDCCKMINEEWKRSDSARLHSLRNSCDELPTSLIILKDKKLIGHLKLTSIPSIKDACFIESVVIDKTLRGKGYGSILMNKAEEYCKNFLRLRSIYLSTKGQEKFYSKLCYVECAPVTIYGSYEPKTIHQPLIIDKSSNMCALKNTSPPPPPMPVNRIISSTKKTFMKKDL